MHAWTCCSAARFVLQDLHVIRSRMQAQWDFKHITARTCVKHELLISSAYAHVRRVLDLPVQNDSKVLLIEPLPLVSAGRPSVRAALGGRLASGAYSLPLLSAGARRSLATSTVNSVIDCVWSPAPQSGWPLPRPLRPVPCCC